jgi:diadenosine tetraphosphatase ApaH/serine/threonine PP2A family protein phosphatase
VSDVNPGGRARYAVFGGVYNNWLALEAVLDDAARRGAVEVFCLGDLGGFGPHPDRVFPILQERGVVVMQGNYDHSIGHGLADCACGYTDPRDNHYARLSYAYTQAKTSARFLPYLRQLPAFLRRDLGGYRVRMVHGSPRQVNEFLWESQSSDAFLRRLLVEYQADVLLCTHTGIPWRRALPAELGGGLVVNVGAIGRPANDGRTCVWYALLDVPEPPLTRLPPASSAIAVEMIAVDYDHEKLCAAMRQESLPEEFVETIATGYWTTCLEILPAKERSRGRY